MEEGLLSCSNNEDPHALELNQEDSLLQVGSSSSSDSDALVGAQHRSPQKKKSMDKHKSFDLLSGMEILKLVKRQESARENAEVAVGQLERRLKFLERSESMKRLPNFMPHDNANGGVLGQATGEKDFTGHYSCIYVSPIYDDKKGNVMYRTQIVEDGCGIRSQSFNKSRDDEKDIEIRKLKAELQRRDLEIRGLKADLQQLRLQDLEDERSIISDKFVDRVNTAREIQLSVDDDCSNSSYGGSSMENASKNTHIWGSFVRTPARYHALKGLGKENISAEKPDTRNELCAVPDYDRAVATPDCSRSNKPVSQSVVSYLATLQASLENVCNNVKMHDPRDSDTSKINSGAVEDELFIMKKTLTKLAEVCQDCSSQSLCGEDCKEPLEPNKVAGATQDTIDGMMQQIAQTEFKVIALESSGKEKDRKLEDLGSRIHGLVKELEASEMENYELTTTIREMYKEAEEQKHRIEELLNINEELLEFSQAKEEQCTSMKKKAQTLRARFKEKTLKLSQKLAGQRKELKCMRDEEGSFRSRNEILKLKLACTEFELAQHEFALERLTSHIEKDNDVKVGDGEVYKGMKEASGSRSESRNDEVEHYSQFLRFSSNREQQSEALLRQTQLCLRELEEKLFGMDVEISKAIKEMSIMTISAF